MLFEDVELVCHEQRHGHSHGKIPKGKYRIIPKNKAISWGARKRIGDGDKPRNVLIEDIVLPSYVDAFQDGPTNKQLCFTDFNNACASLSNNIVRSIDDVLQYGWCGAQDKEWKNHNSNRYVSFLRDYGTEREKKVGVWKMVCKAVHHEIT